MRTVKNYYCAVCRAEYPHSTNHYGQIYISCKNCGNGSLECKDMDPEDTGEPVRTLPVNIHHFRLNIENPEESLQFEEIKADMKARGQKCFEVTEIKYSKYWDIFKSRARVHIRTEHVFENQWNSDLGRVHDFYLSVYPNKKIKNGYYLDLTPELLKLREPKNYEIETWYKGELLGTDIFPGINSSGPQNEAFAKYFKDGMDIFSYSNKYKILE